MLTILALAVKVALIEKELFSWFGKDDHDEFQMEVWPRIDTAGRYVVGWNAARTANTAWVPA